MSAPSTSGLSVELLLRVIDVKYGYFTFLLYFETNPNTNTPLNISRTIIILETKSNHKQSFIRKPSQLNLHWSVYVFNFNHYNFG